MDNNTLEAVKSINYTAIQKTDSMCKPIYYPNGSVLACVKEYLN
jgi:hypothetical protein